MRLLSGFSADYLSCLSFFLYALRPDTYPASGLTTNVKIWKVARHSRTNTSKQIDYEKDTKKESTFVPPLESEPEKFDVDVPLEKEQPMTQNEMEKEEESLEDKPDKDAAVASGASYDDLMKTGEIIRKEESTEQEKDLAGQTLYENRNTEIVETMAASDKQRLEKINSLIHFHMKKHDLNEEEEPSEPDEFNGFDFNSIF